MRIVVGIAEARAVLGKNRGLDLDRVPPQVRKRTEEALGRSLTPTQAVELILNQVREGGDRAVRELTRKLDGTELTETEVPKAAVSEAYDKVPHQVVDALNVAAQRIRSFHERTIIRSWTDPDQGYGQLVNPMQRVGAYIPGGTARYPSTVLMTAIPAKVAGVAEVVVCTPSGEGGLPDPVVLVAADVAGVDRLFRIGGAQAIAAMAYGTESVPRVDMICGPGNIFVTIAKKLLFGEVGIDGLYGPTETMLIADDTANPTLCAADLIAQAEHDTLATPAMITTSKRLAEATAKETLARVERLERSTIARAALQEQGCIAVVADLEEAIDLANEFSPEHLSLMVNDPRSQVERVRNAGAVFVGQFSHEVLGDYVAGPSHVMPTGGTARFSSGLGVHSFVKISPVVALDDATSEELSKAASIIARAEGFTGHAEAAEIRQELR